MLTISKVETFYGNIQALRGVDVKVNSGEILSDKILTCKRPGTGISSSNWDRIIGKRIRFNLFIEILFRIILFLISVIIIFIGLYLESIS